MWTLSILSSLRVPEKKRKVSPDTHSSSTSPTTVSKGKLLIELSYEREEEKKHVRANWSKQRKRLGRNERVNPIDSKKIGIYNLRKKKSYDSDLLYCIKGKFNV